MEQCFLLSTEFRSMSVILTFRCWCVWPRRYLAVLSPAIPPPRMMMCSADDGDVAMPLKANFCTAAAVAG